MKRSIIILFALFLCVRISYAQTQEPDKSVFKEFKAGYYQNYIMKGIKEYEEQQEPTPPAEKYFKMDMTGKSYPKDMKLYKTQWCNIPVSQGNTSTCWCFSTTSFFETEINRLTGNKVKLSEMYTVYWEYVEKARRYIRERGNSAFGEGSEGNAVNRIWKKYGIVPLSDYKGMKPGEKFYNHSKMFAEMENYLKSVKANNLWNEEQNLLTIKSIMNFYMGEPPSMIMVNNKPSTPQEYLKNVLKLNLDDYAEVLSLEQEPFWKQVEYKVPDNWWHNADYYNLPLEDFMKAIKQSIRNGYTMVFGGDVSEPGINSFEQIAVIPSFDIPYIYINDDARQMRFSNHTTEDDHGMHIIGWFEKDGMDWYLVKDSGAGSRNVGEGAESFGYYFIREDYIKLKMLDFTVNKEAIKDLLSKFK